MKRQRPSGQVGETNIRDHFSKTFGILLFIQPVLIGLASLWVIGGWAIAIGIFLIIEAFRRRSRGMPVPA